MWFMHDRFRLATTMSGYQGNGNGEGEVIIGMMGPGNAQGRARPGNQDIGKIANGVTGGIRGTGNKNYELMTC